MKRNLKSLIEVPLNLAMKIFKIKTMENIWVDKRKMQNLKKKIREMKTKQKRKKKNQKRRKQVLKVKDFLLGLSHPSKIMYRDGNSAISFLCLCVVQLAIL